jgi:acyl-CoA synthetase (AMP-forming)/AMP-acid ligase II
VFGVPHERLGEEVAAVVVTDDETLRAADLQAFLQDRLAAYKIPSVLEVRTQALPRNAAGKFLKRSLRDELSRTSEVGGG